MLCTRGTLRDAESALFVGSLPSKVALKRLKSFVEAGKRGGRGNGLREASGELDKERHRLLEVRNHRSVKRVNVSRLGISGT